MFSENSTQLEPSITPLFSFHTVIRTNKKPICPPVFMQYLFCLPWLVLPVTNDVNPTSCMANGAKFEKIENYNSRYQKDTPLPKKIQPPFFREEWDSWSIPMTCDPKSIPVPSTVLNVYWTDISALFENSYNMVQMTPFLEFRSWVSCLCRYSHKWDLSFQLNLLWMTWFGPETRPQWWDLDSEP